ncbi:MAG TPA: sulfite reductase subunit alpha, partial [Opitutus sp.]|nr:sulfite reductase subunit alpha [Opitutus sp.]
LSFPMSLVPLIPESAPFSAEQRAWLNGFFAGMFSRTTTPGNAAATSAAAPLTPLTIIFGSQTGTAESLAKRAAKEAGRRQFAATVLDMAQTDLARLKAEQNILVIVSTYGEGEPPDSAKALHGAITEAANGDSSNATALATVRYSVCALGDTNYPQFCQCGKEFDAFLEKLGASRVSARVDCDVEYEESFTQWLDHALAALGSSDNVGAALRRDEPAALRRDEEIQSRGKPAPTSIQSEPNYSRKKPFPALLLTSRNLNAAGSAKQVHHIEFDLAASGLVYEAGDALGVYAHNCPDLVSDILGVLGCDGEEAVPTPDGATTSLRHALTELYDLGKPTAELMARCHAVSPVPVTSDGTQITPAWHHVIDVLFGLAGAKISPNDFVQVLKRIQPRLYSISSSPKAHVGQVHLTVGAVRYDQAGRPRKGVCSTFLADRAQPGITRVGVYVHANHAFRPPAQGDTPMIMVGPGTGIAPFRGFLHDRRASGATGKNWLLFGDQRAATDFLYRHELDNFSREGVLTRIDTAFSRDQAEKIYVQHRLLENASELYAWLEAGAHFYVCGDASRMAKDVDLALHRVVMTAAGKTTEQAAEYVQKLKAAKRYARDVY